MISEKQSTAAIGLLTYNHEKKHLELNNILLRCGTSIEIRVIGYWIPGSVQHDNGGWYLLTVDHVGLRLHPGLTARPSTISPHRTNEECI
jgi:Domain of unknown function (DUF5348)